MTKEMLEKDNERLVEQIEFQEDLYQYIINAVDIFSLPPMPLELKLRKLRIGKKSVEASIRRNRPSNCFLTRKDESRIADLQEDITEVENEIKEASRESKDDEPEPTEQQEHDDASRAISGTSESENDIYYL